MGELRTNILHGNIDETIISLMNMNHIARRMGLLALEELLEEPYQLPLMVRAGLSLVIDGMDEADIEEILSNLMEAGDLKLEEEIKEAKVIKQGLLSLRRGENPMIFLPKLVSHLGFKSYFQYVICNGYTNNQEKSWIYGYHYGEQKEKEYSLEEMLSFLNKDSNEQEVSELVKTAIGELTRNYDNLEAVLGRTCSPELFAAALHVLSENQVKELLEQSLIPEELYTIYQNDQSSEEIRIRQANLLTDLMMGGDGSEYQ